MTGWHVDLSVVAGLVLLAALYGLGIKSRGQPDRPFVERALPFQVMAFIAALVTLFVALQSPLDRLGDTYLFSLHMAQHLLLILVVPPLLLLGTPGWLLRPLLRPTLIRWIAGRVTAVPFAFLAFNLVFAVAHVPTVFDMTLRHEGIHITEHLLFVATGVLTWWPILSPLPELPRLSYPFQMLYLFLQTLPCALIGAFITLTHRLLYTPYVLAPRIWNLSPLEDQQIGGLAMWVGESLYFFLAFSIVFFLWAHRDEHAFMRLRVLDGQAK